MLISPTTKMMIDSTDAKIGLSTKKREKFTAKASRSASEKTRLYQSKLNLKVCLRQRCDCDSIRCRHIDVLRRHFDTRKADLLQAVYHDVFTRVQTIGDHQQAIHPAASFDGASCDAIVFTQHIQVAAILIGQHRFLIDQ